MLNIQLFVILNYMLCQDARLNYRIDTKTDEQKKNYYFKYKRTIRTKMMIPSKLLSVLSQIINNNLK